MKTKRIKRRLTPKEYAFEKGLHVTTVYKRIESGILKSEQDAKGCRVTILL